MSQSIVTTGRSRICIVQPVQSPYWTLRLQSLAAFKNLDLSLLLERASFGHRPDWTPRLIDGVKVEVVGSSVFSSICKRGDLGYEIQTLRSIPWRMTATLWRNRPDVVVLCNATQLLFALPVKWFRGSRIAITVEDTVHAARNLGFLTRHLKAWVYRRADCWFAFSEDAKEYLSRIGIVNGVYRSSWSLDMQYFRPRRLEERKTGQGDVGVLRTALFIGRLSQAKGVMHLLEAWRGLEPETRQACRLKLVGDGPLAAAIKRYVVVHGLENVECLGHIPYDQVQQLLSSSDLFVLPTLQDLFSLTVVEAMASGCAVITTPFNGARELVEPEKSGWIVDPSVPHALIEVLEKALSPETDLSSMGLAARARVEHMDNAKVMAEFARLLLKLANR